MLHNRVRLSQTASGRLDRVSKRLGIRKNLLCRVALLLSLEKGEIDLQDKIETDGLEFNLSTLFGSFTGVFVDMINIVQPDSSDDTWANYANIHIERGADFLQTNIKNTEDLSSLFVDV